MSEAGIPPKPSGMLDLTVHASTQIRLKSFYVGRGLEKPDGTPEEGFESCLWAGTGKLMVAKAVLDPTDPEGPPLTPAKFLDGIVALARLYGERYTDDAIIPKPKDPNRDKQWARSELALWFKSGSNSGETQGVSWFGKNGVRLYDPVELNRFLESKDLPGHRWAGGNYP